MASSCDCSPARYKSEQAFTTAGQRFHSAAAGRDPPAPLIISDTRTYYNLRHTNIKCNHASDATSKSRVRVYRDGLSHGSWGRVGSCPHGASSPCSMLGTHPTSDKRRAQAARKYMRRLYRSSNLLVAAGARGRRPQCPRLSITPCAEARSRSNWSRARVQTVCACEAQQGEAE